MFKHIFIYAAIYFFLATEISFGAESLSMRAAIDRALAANPDMAAARAIWEEARAQALRAAAPSPPELELDYEGLPSVVGFDRYAEREISLQQRLDFPLKWRQRTRAARLRAEGMRLATYEAMRLDIARDVQMEYDRVLADVQIAEWTAQYVQSAADLLTRLQVQQAVGDVPRLDVLRAEVALRRLENKQMQAQHAEAQSRSRLNALLGYRPDLAIELTDTLAYHPAVYAIDSLYAQALQRRGDVLGAEKLRDSAAAQRQLARSAWIPDLAIRVGRQTLNTPVGQERAWHTAIALELPLWGLIDQRGLIAQASAQYAQANADKERATLRALQEVHAAHLDYSTATKRVVQVQDHIYPAAEAVYAMAQRSYDAGEVAYLDMLRAQQDLIEVGIERVEALYAYRTARVRLLRAIGEESTLVQVTE
jgi:cobalt-zinc-cadmium efflux system outer membrane protein